MDSTGRVDFWKPCCFHYMKFVFEPGFVTMFTTFSQNQLIFCSASIKCAVLKTAVSSFRCWRSFEAQDETLRANAHGRSIPNENVAVLQWLWESTGKSVFIYTNFTLEPHEEAQQGELGQRKIISSGLHGLHAESKGLSYIWGDLRQCHCMPMGRWERASPQVSPPGSIYLLTANGCNWNLLNKWGEERLWKVVRDGALGKGNASYYPWPGSVVHSF